MVALYYFQLRASLETNKNCKVLLESRHLLVQSVSDLGEASLRFGTTFLFLSLKISRLFTRQAGDNRLIEKMLENTGRNFHII